MGELIVFFIGVLFLYIFMAIVGTIVKFIGSFSSFGGKVFGALGYLIGIIILIMLLPLLL